MPIYSRIALVVNAEKAGAAVLSREVRNFLKEQGVTVKETDQHPIPKGFLQGVDLCLSIGGDGTILGVVEEAHREQVPIFGINCGKLGFLTAISGDQVVDFLNEMLQGKLVVQKRQALVGSSGDEYHFVALNDIVIKPYNPLKLSPLQVIFDGREISEYTSDGLIFSTATGSTAYNLSSGGPIIHPEVEAIVMTPICPHSLSHRSMVLPTNKVVEVICATESRMSVWTDGRQYFETHTSKSFSISISPHPILLGRLPSKPYFKVLGEKLHWGNR